MIGVKLFFALVLGYPVGIVFEKYGSIMFVVVGSMFYVGGIFGMAEITKF